MQLQRELPNRHSIQSYAQGRVCIQKTWYDQTLFISETSLLTALPLQSLAEFHVKDFLKKLPYPIDILIIGQSDASSDLLSAAQQVELLCAKIGVECMIFGAACRTFNVLLSEGRRVGLLLIMGTSANPPM